MPDLQDVDPGNADQARAWDGDAGSLWTRNADAFERSMARYSGPFLDAAGITDGTTVLDIGCGTGDTTRAAARLAGSGSALGVDLSAEMIERAASRAARDGVTNATFLRADAQVYPFERQAYDLAISRTGCMFFADPGAAFANFGRALRPGGRLVLLVWAEPDRNEWFRAPTTAVAGRELPAPPPGVPSPFSMRDPDRTREVLQCSGFSAVSLGLVQQPMHFGVDERDAYAFFTQVFGWLLAGLAEPDRDRAHTDLQRVIAEHVTADGVLFGSAAWLVTARKP